MKIVVIGTSCSGKTTFSQKLAEKTGVPHIELDQLHWLPDWQEKEDSVFRQLVKTTIDENPTWIMDGNYKVVRDLTWGAANTVIWLNYPFWLVLSRAVWRTVSRVVTRKPLFHNNRESFRQAFLSKDSIIYWVLKTFYRRKRQFSTLIQQPRFQHIQFVELTHPQQAVDFLTDIHFN